MEGTKDMKERTPTEPAEAGGKVEARSLLAPGSPLSQVVEFQQLPEMFESDLTSEIVDIKVISDTVATLRKGDGYYEAQLYDKGKSYTFFLDPSNMDIANYLEKRNDSININREYMGGVVPERCFMDFGFSEPTCNKLKDDWYRKTAYLRVDFANSERIKGMGKVYFSTGEWGMGIESMGTEEKGYFPSFIFTNRTDCFSVNPQKINTKDRSNIRSSTSKEILEGILKLPNSLELKPAHQLFYITDENDKELASYSGFSPKIDPATKKLYFINTGKIYSLDASNKEQIATRAARPEAEVQIKVQDPQEIEFDPNGNFIIIRSKDNKLFVVDKESGGVVKDFEDVKVKGPIFVDSCGDIFYADIQNQLRKIQTNFQSIPVGGIEAAQKRREEELRQMQERFANLELKKVEGRKGGEISEKDVAETLRQSIARQVSEQIATSNDPSEIEDILDRLQGLKGDPANQAYGEVVDEFIDRARERLSGIRTAEFDSQLTAYQQVLDDVKSVGDTIGLDEQFAKLLELRQKIDITDPQKRREVEQRLRSLQSKKDTLNNQYQGELVEAVKQTLPQIEQLINETGSVQELAYFSTTTYAQQFEMILVNIKDPQVRRELRDKYNAIKAEQRARLEESSRQLEEQDRQRWAQIVEEAREDLRSLQEQIEQLSVAREIDRFSKNPLVTAWRAKLFALPAELREIEEKKLEIILGARKKDIEHRRELGAVREAGELKFGNATFPVYREPPRIWQAKLVARKGGFSGLADLVFEDSQGRIWRPEGEQEVVVNADMSNERTKNLIERYRREADEYFRGIKRRVPEFDEHWRITNFHMVKLEEIAEALNLQLANHRGILILQGEAGTGKNVLIDILANLSNREVVQIACNENTVKEDLTYEFYYDPEKGTYKLPSRLVEGIQTPGTIVVWDEVNALRPGIAKLHNSLFDYRRRIYLPEGGGQKEIIADPTVLFVATMNPQNYLGVSSLSPEVKSRARIVDLDYPPFEEMRGGRTYYRSDEAEMLAAYMDRLGELTQKEFRQVWDYVINRDQSSGGDVFIQGNAQLESDVRRVYDVLRVANRLREMYEAYQVGDSNEPMFFPTSLREVTDIVMEMNHRQGVKPIIKRVIIPKIDGRSEKRLVEQTIDSLLPD